MQTPYSPVAISENIFTLSELQAKNALIKMRETLRAAGKQVFSNQGILTDVNLLNDEEVKTNFEKWKDGLLEIVGVVQSLGTAFSQVFTTLISGGTHAFKALTQALVGLLAKLVATVVEAAILSAILTAVTGGSSLVVGGAGFGNILKSLLGGGLQFHADGGIFTKATRIGNHVFGENGPEILAPLDKLQSMFGNGVMGNNNGGQVVFRISGTELVGVLNRGNLKNSRNYGNNFNKPN